MTKVQICNDSSQSKTLSPICSRAASWLLAARRSWPVLVMAALLTPAAVQAQGAKDVQVGVAKSMFKDVEQAKIMDLTDTFGELMYRHTKLVGKVQVSGDAF